MARNSFFDAGRAIAKFLNANPQDTNAEQTLRDELNALAQADQTYLDQTYLNNQGSSGTTRTSSPLLPVSKGIEQCVALKAEILKAHTTPEQWRQDVDKRKIQVLKLGGFKIQVQQC